MGTNVKNAYVLHGVWVVRRSRHANVFYMARSTIDNIAQVHGVLQFAIITTAQISKSCHDTE